MLAEFEEEKARPIMKQIELSLSKGKGLDRWVGIFIDIIVGLLLFVMGVWLGPLISKWLGISK
jgi:tetrahydromethanopterin S-methyltransferase subunit G